jgi:hypothetical protein
MQGINQMVRKLLSVVEVPFFGAAVCAITVLGEANLFSATVRYGTEQIGSVGVSLLYLALPILGFVILTMLTPP